MKLIQKLVMVTAIVMVMTPGLYAAGLAAADPIPIPTNAAQANAESLDLARLRPAAEKALKEIVWYRWPYMAPGNDPAKVQDYGGDWPVQLLAMMVRYRTPAFVALAREASGTGGTFTASDIAAAEQRGFDRALAAVRVKIGEVRKIGPD